MMYRGGDITNFAKSFPVSGHSTSQYVVLLIGKFNENGIIIRVHCTSKAMWFCKGTWMVAILTRGRAKN